MSDAAIAGINDVIAVLRGGAGFYRDAADKVETPALAELFLENAAKREQAVADLDVYVLSHGKIPANGSVAEAAYAWYASALANFGNRESTLVAQLEEHEDRTLQELRDAMERIPADTSAYASLDRHLETFGETHDRMKAMKSVV